MAECKTNLVRFRFQYRITPLTTTGLMPAEMLLGRKPKSHLDLLHPDVVEKVRAHQRKQKVGHDKHERSEFHQRSVVVTGSNHKT